MLPHPPTEILLEVFSHLAVPPGSYSENGIYKHDPKRAISRRTLLTLTRSGSRRLCQAATHYLYHTVVLDSLDSFFLFLRTIVRADDLAKRVRVLWCCDIPLLPVARRPLRSRIRIHHHRYHERSPGARVPIPMLW